jgi:hypothetical protein
LYGLTEWTEKSVLETKKGKPVSATEPDNNTVPKSKYNWPQFVRESLIRHKRVLSLTEFVKYAMKHFEIPAGNMKSIRGSIAPTISTLGKSKVLKSVSKKGFKGKSYGLAEWFDNNGNLISLYK